VTLHAEPNLAGVTFQLANEDLLASPLTNAVATDLNGEATIDDVPPGTYEVTVTNSAGQSEQVPGAGTVTMPFPAAAPSYTETFSDGGSASGTVLLNDDAATGTTGNDGFAEGATVTISNGSGYSESATVAANGTWSITGIPQANGYDIAYELDGYVDVDDTVDVTGAMLLGNVTMDKLASLTVTVVDESAAAVIATSIGLYTAADGATRADHDGGTATTDASGSSFTFTSLTPGDTIFAIAALAGHTMVDSTPASVDLDAGDNEIELELTADGSIDVDASSLSDGSIDVTFAWVVPGDTTPIDITQTYTDGGTVTSTESVPGDVPITILVDDTDSSETCTIDGTGANIDTGESVPPGTTVDLSIVCS
jgi:hypothetical protein